ncbi:MAG: hypothetical protein ACT4OM_02575 [Actinomycetota bacterium]
MAPQLDDVAAGCLRFGRVSVPPLSIRSARLCWLVALLLLLLLPGTAVRAGVPEPMERPNKVVIVTMPRVSWEHVVAGDAPNLKRLAGDWSIAAMSLRTVGPRTDLASALITIGAGNRARAHGAQPSEEGDADSAPIALVDDGGGAAVRGFGFIQLDNADLHFGAVPGTLGGALAGAGLRTGVAGNADGGFLRSTDRLQRGLGLERKRFGALALADLSGKVGRAEIGDELVIKDSRTLNGYRSDPEALLAAAMRIIEASEVSLIELSDTYRESQIAFADLRSKNALTPPVPEVRAAVRRDDALLGRIAGSIDLATNTLIVLSTSSAAPAQREQLALALAAGVGAERSGWLTSATTLREGIVTISDVGPGILRLLGLEVPEQMLGLPLRATPGGGSDRLDRIIRLQEQANFHVRWVGLFFLVLVGAQAVIYLLAYLLLRRRGDGGSPWVRRLALGFMAVPVSTLLLAGFDIARIGWAGPLALLLVFSTGLAALALVGPWRSFPAGPATFLCAVNVLVIVVDLASGANLQLSSLIGYSPIVAGRFYGLGNLAFAVLATSALLLAGQLGASLGRRGVWAAGAVGVAAIVADGGPGADFGGMLSLIPAFGLLLALLMGKRVSFWRMVLLLALGAIVAIVAGVLDSLRPAEAQTHVGRFVQRLIGSGPEGVKNAIFRKLTANWSVLTRSSLTWSVPVAAGFLLMMLKRTDSSLRLALQTQPGLRTGVIAAIVANLLGFALNDSGIAIPAMGVAILAPFCLATVEGMKVKGQR